MPLHVPYVTRTELASLVSVEELVAGVLRETVTATVSHPIFHAPFACRVVSFALVNQNTTITANDTNYWSIALRKFSGGASTVIATKTTQATGGETIGQRVPWTYNAITFDATNKVLAADDHIDVALTKVAAATSLTGPILFQVRYEPV